MEKLIIGSRGSKLALKYAEIAKKALKNNTTLKNEVLKSGLMNEKEYQKIVDPRKMIQPA